MGKKIETFDASKPSSVIKRYFLQKKNMSSHRAEHGEQIPIHKIFSKGFVRIGNCARITFTTTLKIAGKYDFFKFCKPYISSRFHPTQEIVYIQTLGGSPTNWLIDKVKIVVFYGGRRNDESKSLNFFRH
jgi:hypothetical protein